MSYKDKIEKLCDAGLHPARTILKTKEETGKDLVGCFPIHTPDEIIYAAGCVPVGLWGGRTEIQLADKYLQSFCCSIMRTNIEYALRGSYDSLKAVVIPTFCDTLKCMVENMKIAMPNVPTIAMAYPQHRAIKPGIEFTVSEILRVRHELEKVLGKIITEEQIQQAFDVYEEYRKTMREFVKEAELHPEIITAKKRHLIIKAGFYMDKERYTAEIKSIIEGLRSEEPSTFKGKKVILTGLLCEPVEILDIIDENNIAVVADDLTMGSRIWRTLSREAEADVFLKMAYQIADAKGDTFFYDPNKEKGKMLIEMVKNHGADAVVVMMMKFCDPEEYDYPIFKEELEKAGIPELYLEIDQQLATFEQIRTRIQSFTEMLM